MPFSKHFAYISLALMCLYSLSELPLHQYGFVQGAVPLSLLLLLVSLIFIFLKYVRPVLFPLIACFCTLASLYGFLSTSGGKLLFSDDHPCFLYRLIQLKENFPSIPFYNPLWNAGVEAREFFASGVLNVFFLFSPLIYALDLTSTYTILIAALLFVVFPALLYLSAMLAGQSKNAAAVLSILGLSNSLVWYHFSLSFGTIGFVFSSMLLPLNLVLISKLFDDRSQLTPAVLILCIASLSLMLMWSLSLLFLVPLLLYAALKAKVLLKKKYVASLLLALLLINLPWMLIFFKVSKVGDFIAGGRVFNQAQLEAASAQEAALSFEPSKFKNTDSRVTALSAPSKMAQKLFDYAIAANPLIVFFGLLGLLAIPDKSQRRIFTIALVSAFTLASLGPIWKPQLELERMYIYCLLILAYPAALLISNFTGNVRAPLPTLLSRIHCLVVASLLAIFALTPYWLWRLSSARTIERYTLASQEVFDLAEKIKSLAGEGRTLFAGFTLHELGGGHVAPLAAWTGKPLIASSYQHDSWQYKDVIPEQFRKRKTPGVLDYLKLMNVSLIVTHDQFWRKWFSSRPQHFKRIWQTAGFQIFMPTKYRSDYFISGQGEVLEQTGSSVLLRLKTSEAVIKFNYLPFLQVDACEIEAETVRRSLKFIKLKSCNLDEPIRIKAAPIWQRMISDLWGPL